MTHVALTIASETCQRVLRHVIDNPGRSTELIAEACGWSKTHTGKALTALHKAKLIGRVAIGGPTARWFAASMMAEALDMQTRARQRIKRDNNARTEMARKSKGLPDDLPLIQRRADARAPLPFVCRAPASVFHLGGVL